MLGSCPVASCRVVLCRVMSYRRQESLTRVVSRWFFFSSCYVASRHLMSLTGVGVVDKKRWFLSCHVGSSSRVPSEVMHVVSLSCHVASCHVVSCFVVDQSCVPLVRLLASRLRSIMSCRVMSCRVVSRRVASCRVLSRRVASSHVVD